MFSGGIFTTAPCISLDNGSPFWIARNLSRAGHEQRRPRSFPIKTDSLNKLSENHNEAPANCLAFFPSDPIIGETIPL